MGAQDSSATRTTHPVELHGFLQVYLRAGDPGMRDGFRLRKADLKFTGEVAPRLRWRVTFDASKALTINKTVAELGDSLALSDAAIDQRTRILQDAALTYKHSPAFGVDVGQQILPLSLEGTISTANVETIERSMFIIERSRAVGLGDIREVGVSANGLLSDVLEYHLGVFNETGEAAGTIDPNDQKAVMSRVSVHIPSVTGLQVGGSGGFQGGPRPQRRERAGSEVQYRNSHLTLRGETMFARDGELRRFGWYGLTAYRPNGQLQLVGRFDAWDRDTRAELSGFDGFERQIVLGASYLLDGTAAKVAFNVVHQTFPNVTNAANGTFVLIAFQGSW